MSRCSYAKNAWLWGPPLLWMILIFIGSGNVLSASHTSRFLEPLIRWVFPALTPEQVWNAVVVIRKCGHLSEYAVLAVLFWRSLSGGLWAVWNPRIASLAWILTSLYAVSDEIHQAFVPTRECALRDVIIDCIGAAVGLLVLNRVSRWRGPPGCGVSKTKPK